MSWHTEGTRVVVLVDRQECAGTVIEVGRVLTKVKVDGGAEVWRSHHDVFDMFNDGTTP